MITIWKRTTIKKDILILMKRETNRSVFSSKEMCERLRISVKQMKKAKEFLVKDGSIETVSPGKFKLVSRTIRLYNSRIYNRCVFITKKDNGYSKSRPYCVIKDKFLEHTDKCDGTVVMNDGVKYIEQHCKFWEPSTGPGR